MNGSLNDADNRTPSFVLPSGDDRESCPGVVGAIFMENFDCLRRVDSSPDLANLFLTCAKASGEASRLGGFRVRQGIGNMLTIGGTPYGKPMLATIERWDGFRSGSFGACFAFGQR